METSIAERKRLARASHAFNRKGALFVELFPNLVQEPTEEDAEAEAAEQAAQAARAEAGDARLTSTLYISCAVVVCAVVGCGFLQQQL